jgi:small neutral amino acid transporter SnatA (MarC family)
METQSPTSSSRKLIAIILGTLVFFFICILIQIIGNAFLTLLGIYSSSNITRWIIGTTALVFSVIAARMTYRNHIARRP